MKRCLSDTNESGFIGTSQGVSTSSIGLLCAAHIPHGSSPLCRLIKHPLRQWASCRLSRGFGESHLHCFKQPFAYLLRLYGRLVFSLNPRMAIFFMCLFLRLDSGLFEAFSDFFCSGPTTWSGACIYACHTEVNRNYVTGC